MMSQNADPMFDRIQAAKKRLSGQAHVTPVMTSRTLDRRVGATVYLKCENYQRVGAFKFRGAYNAMAQLAEEDRKRGVITHSSNHAPVVRLVQQSFARSLQGPVVVVPPQKKPAVEAA